MSFMQYANTCSEFSSLLVSCAGGIHSVSNGHSKLNFSPLIIPFTALSLALPVVATSSATAQQPVRPLPKVGGCPVGYYASGVYCVPSKSGNSRGAIEKVGNGCPVGFYASGNYCLSSPSNLREAMEKQGNSCPIGWFSSGRYCVKNR